MPHTNKIPLSSSNKENRTILLLFIALSVFFGYVFCCLPIGIGVADESFYYTMVKRFAEGDRIIADEWKVNQFFTVLLIIPYKLYIHFVGSTEGLILFTRYLFTTVEFLFSAYLCNKLKRYGWIALLFALTLFTVSPILNFSYYNISVNCIALILTERFASEKPISKRKTAALGAIAAVAVLANPILSLLYFVYTLLVFLLPAFRKKSNGAAKQAAVKEWSFFTLGVLSAASLFLLYFSLSYHFDFTALAQNFPELFRDPNYALGLFAKDDHFSNYLQKLFGVCYVFGLFFVGVDLVLILGAFIWERRGASQKIRAILFYSACGTFFLQYMHLAYIMFFSRNTSFRFALYNLPIRGFSLPIVVFCLICILLSDRVEPMYTAFWTASVLVSVPVDYASLICFSYAGILSLFPCLLCCRELILSLQPPRKNEEKKTGGRADDLLSSGTLNKAARILPMVLIILPVVLWGGYHTFLRTQLPRSERFNVAKPMQQSLDQKIDKGPLKGIKTTASIMTRYDNMLEDMDAVMQYGNGPLYVHYISPLPYLYASLPIGTYSVWGDEDLEMDRAVRYWTLHPDKIPSVIYLPLYDSTVYVPLEESFIETEMAKLDALFDYDVSEGKAGYILKVNKLL